MSPPPFFPPIEIYLFPLGVLGYICGRYLRFPLGLVILYVPYLILVQLFPTALRAVPFILYTITVLLGYVIGLFQRKKAQGSLKVLILMRTEIKAGLMLLGVGVLLFMGLIALGVLFVGSAGVSPPPSPLRELVFCLYALAMTWWVAAIVGAVLIVYGLIQRKRDNKRDTDT